MRPLRLRRANVELRDNAKLPPIGPVRTVDERNQTNWNGMVGRVEPRATAPVWLDDILVYPNSKQKKARVRAVVGNITTKAASVEITVRCESHNVDKPFAFKNQPINVQVGERENIIEFAYDPGENVSLWDEFEPAMLRLTLNLKANVGNEQFSDRRSVNFGMRDLTKARNRLKISGRLARLRGKTDCCLFSLAGCPPTGKDGWIRVLSIAKSYGINHLRIIRMSRNKMLNTQQGHYESEGLCQLGQSKQIPEWRYKAQAPQRRGEACDIVNYHSDQKVVVSS